MTLTQLTYLVAVDKYRSFVAAAEHCDVSQPTLSMQLQKLERSIGAKIFDRSRHPIFPTAIGEKIIRQAKLILAESNRMQELLRAEKGEISGELNVGVIPTVAPYLLPDVLEGFIGKHPDLRLRIWEHTTDRILQDLKNGHLDCGILSTPLRDTEIEVKPLYYEPFVAYVSEKSPLSQKKMLTSEELVGERLWLLNEGHCMRGQVLNFCAYQHNRTADGDFEYHTGSVEMLKRMVDINSGATVLPEMSVLGYDGDRMDRVRYFKPVEPVREISLVTSPNFVKKLGISALTDEIRLIVPERYKTNKKKRVMPF